MPGSPQGIPDWSPTIADLLKEQGYATGQFGKNHLGDRDKHLPTVHGFDEFFGNLYHLNAEEEPETYYYPKDPSFRKKYGPRGVLHYAGADGEGRAEDRGHRPAHHEADGDHRPGDPRSRENVHRRGGQGQERRSSSGSTPRGCTSGPTSKRRPRADRNRASIPDGMVEHDDIVGELLKQLEDLGIADNTIVVYGTDNGAETVSWPDGGTTPFHGEKGTTWEGGFRVPMLVRWPGVIKPGTIINEIFSQEDWMPTLLAAAGEPDIVEKLKQGYKANSKTFKIHADGYNFLPLFQGRNEKSRARRFSTSARGAT